MSKNKSILVTALFSVMLATIIVFIAVMDINKFPIGVAPFAIYGFVCLMRDFYKWLMFKSPEKKPQHRAIRQNKEESK